MSWFDLLQDASFKGFSFDCQRTQDTSARDVSTYAYPYVDGEDTQDQGRRGRRFSITAVFFGDLYEVQLESFLAVLDQPGLGELIHPVYGSIPKAQLLNHSVDHDAEEPDYATVQLFFLEHKDSNPFFSDTSGTFGSAKINASMALAWLRTIENFTAAIGAIEAELTSASLGLFQRTVSLGNTMGGTVNSLRTRYPGTTSSSADYVAQPAAFTADVEAAMPLMSAERTFTSEAMFDWREMVAESHQVNAIPTAVVGGVADAETALEPIPIAAGDLAKIETVVTLAVADEVADTAAQILQGELETPLLSPIEIEELVADARGFINAAIGKQRENLGSIAARPIVEPLKNAALELQQMAQAVILARPPLVQREVQTPGNLHLIAYRWYGDYTRAAELLRLNPSIRNPNFITRGEVLNGYAK